METTLRKMKTNKDNSGGLKTVGNVSFSQDNGKMKKTVTDALSKFTGATSQMEDLVTE